MEEKINQLCELIELIVQVSDDRGIARHQEWILDELAEIKSLEVTHGE